MNPYNGGNDAGNALRGVIIKIRDGVGVMIGRKIRKICDGQLHAWGALSALESPDSPALRR